MRTTRRVTLFWTLAAAALASIATVLALPGGGGATTQERPANTAEPRITGAASVGSTLSTSNGVKVDGANVVKTDIVADNGVIHVIDSVVLPK